MNKKANSSALIEKKFDELPDIFKERIAMLQFSLNYSTQKYWCRAKEIEACHKAYKIAMRVLENNDDLKQKRARIYIKNLASAYMDHLSKESRDDYFDSKVMMANAEHNIAQPRDKYIARYVECKANIPFRYSV